MEWNGIEWKGTQPCANDKDPRHAYRVSISVSRTCTYVRTYVDPKQIKVRNRAEGNRAEGNATTTYVRTYWCWNIVACHHFRTQGPLVFHCGRQCGGEKESIGVGIILLHASCSTREGPWFPPWKAVWKGKGKYWSWNIVAFLFACTVHPFNSLEHG